MVTITFCFPHHATRQTEVRSIRAHAGSPVTAILPSPVSPTKQMEWRSVRTHLGSPVTSSLAFMSPPTVTELRYSRANVGSSVTETLAFVLPPTRTELRSIHRQAGSPITERLAFLKLPTQIASIRWKAERRVYTTAVIHLRNDYHNLTTSSIYYNYDWKMIVSTSLKYRYRSLVQAGWKIVAKNLETNDIFEIGFIDAESDNPVLEDVFLPDGDYEISVLTSSLFWKDCQDRVVRTISVRPGEEVTPLPTIYNLRSTVLNGVTTIRWSANRSELDDCVFGVWYDSDSPVDTDSTPDTTVWYYASETEYETTFYQNAPAWVAVAAIRTGDEPETGRVHELYLDWSNVPPRHPDDIIIFDKPLPAIDTTIEKRGENGEFWEVWSG